MKNIPIVTIVIATTLLLSLGYDGMRAAETKDMELYQENPPRNADVDQLREWRQETREERCAWWKNARFGMFIHWGVYAVPAGKYNGKRINDLGSHIMKDARIPVKEYKEYAKEFDPVKYDPDAWVRLAKEAGMKYIVITAKHHDGFALFDSAVTDWDMVDATPYGKDLLKPISEACREHGIKLGFYYSHAQDWVHSSAVVHSPKQVTHWDEPNTQYSDMDNYLAEIAAPQIREILTNYGDLGILWWDTPYHMNRERAEMLYPLLKLQPHIITNDRLGAGFGGDYGTPERKIPGHKQGKNWETCMTMNRTWGYKSYDDNWKSTRTLIRQLVDIVSKGGNYLLNVGPTAEGEFPEASIERLEQIGKWMDVNSESIHGCNASPFQKRQSWGRITSKPGKLFLHVFSKPESGKLEIQGLKDKINTAYMLSQSGKEELPFQTVKETVEITLPAKLPNAIDTVIALDIKGTP